LLLQGDGGRQALNAVDFGDAHLIEQTPGIGGDGFKVATLSLSI
jgi:hypothetical protein